jgi:hypothetical protein
MFVSSQFPVNWFYLQILQYLFFLAKRVYSAVIMKNFISIDASGFLSLFKGKNFASICKNGRTIPLFSKVSGQKIV